MGILGVTIRDEVKDRKLELELSDNVKLEKLLPILLKKHDLPTTNSEGNPITYCLMHMDTGKVLGQDQTLASFGVKAGDELKLSSAYIVQPGDSLSKIAKAVYGDANRWPEIAAANKEQVPDPNLIRPGQELYIP